ncbi:MAG: hypothetical protein R3C53_12350 [Pirellulaceae bacterium]
MHSVDLLEEALRLADQAGFEIRQEWLPGATGGLCRIGDRQILYANLSLTAEEQLEQVTASLRNSERFVEPPNASPQLLRLLKSQA